jgi:hypothetical protein
VQNIGALVHGDVFVLDAVPHCFGFGVDGSPVRAVLECLVGIHRDVIHLLGGVNVENIDGVPIRCGEFNAGIITWRGQRPVGDAVGVDHAA